MHSNCVNNNINDMNSNDILCNIYCASVNFSNHIGLYYNLVENMKPYIWPASFFTFKITNEDGDKIYLNGCEINFTINFFTYIPLNKIYKLLWDYWKTKIAEKIKNK